MISENILISLVFNWNLFHLPARIITNILHSTLEKSSHFQNGFAV